MSAAAVSAHVAATSAASGGVSLAFSPSVGIPSGHSTRIRMSSIGASTFFRATNPIDSAGGGSSRRRYIAMGITMSPLPACPHMRLPMLTVSPTMSYWRRLPPPTCAATTSPEFMPMPKCAGGMPMSSSFCVNTGAQRWMAIAHSSATWGWFSTGSGAPNTANTSSPTNFSTVPRWSSVMSVSAS